MHMQTFFRGAIFALKSLRTNYLGQNAIMHIMQRYAWTVVRLAGRLINANYDSANS